MKHTQIASEYLDFDPQETVNQYFTAATRDLKNTLNSTTDISRILSCLKTNKKKYFNLLKDTPLTPTRQFIEQNITNFVTQTHELFYLTQLVISSLFQKNKIGTSKINEFLSYILYFFYNDKTAWFFQDQLIQEIQKNGQLYLLLSLMDLFTSLDHPQSMHIDGVYLLQFTELLGKKESLKKMLLEEAQTYDPLNPRNPLSHQWLNALRLTLNKNGSKCYLILDDTFKELKSKNVIITQDLSYYLYSIFLDLMRAETARPSLLVNYFQYIETMTKNITQDDLNNNLQNLINLLNRGLKKMLAVAFEADNHPLTNQMAWKSFLLLMKTIDNINLNLEQNNLAFTPLVNSILDVLFQVKDQIPERELRYLNECLQWIEKKEFKLDHEYAGKKKTLSKLAIQIYRPMSHAEWLCFLKPKPQENADIEQTRDFYSKNEETHPRNPRL